MTSRQELKLILELIRKYSLPLSPILEYAINEKLEEFSEDKDNDKSDYVNEDTSALEPCEDDSPKQSLGNHSSRYIIKVTYPDGRVFCSKQVWKTLVDVVKYARPERVRQLQITCMGDNLVSPKLNDNPIYRSSQKSIGDGLYVCAYSSTDVKFNHINRINKALHLGLKVEKVEEDQDIDGEIQYDHDEIEVNGSPQRSFAYSDYINTTNQKHAIHDNTQSVDSSVDKRIGYVIRLFPSLQKGEIIGIKADGIGVKKIVVKTVSGDVLEIDDLPYLYEVLEQENKTDKKSEDVPITIKDNDNIESRKGRSWTQDEEEQIETLYHRGVDFATIAEKLGRTELAIKCRLAKLGLIDYTYGEDEPIREDQIEHVYLNEKGEAIKREMGGKNAETEENDVEEDESEIEEEVKSQVRKGTRVRLLPSQVEGVVVNHITTKSGEKRIVIQKDDGSIFSALDHPYLYEKVRKRRRRIGESRMTDDVRAADKHSDAETNNKSSIKEQFRSYLAWRKPDSTANGYTSTLDNPVRRWINKEVDERADSIFSYTTSEDVRLCIDLLKASPGFSAENARQHNRMSAALSQYLLFIEDRESKSKK